MPCENRFLNQLNWQTEVLLLEMNRPEELNSLWVITWYLFLLATLAVCHVAAMCFYHWKPPCVLDSVYSKLLCWEKWRGEQHRENEKETLDIFQIKLNSIHGSVLITCPGAGLFHVSFLQKVPGKFGYQLQTTSKDKEQQPKGSRGISVLKFHFAVMGFFQAQT